VASAADLVYDRGVAGTSLDEVLAASRTSKSQLYHYFADKDGLVRAVIAEQLNYWNSKHGEADLPEYLRC